MKKVIVEWKFQCKKWDFGFVIPENRSEWGGDFFVHQKNFSGARDNDRVKAEVLDRVSGKKPEAKIIEVIWKKPESKVRETLEVVEWVFSSGSWDFWFVDVPGREEGYFCYGLKKNGAQDGDTVKAEIKKYNGKKEAIVVEILWKSWEVLEGIFSDNTSFWFVKVGWWKPDIFVPWWKTLEAKTGDKVSVRVIKTSGRRPEWVIEEILL